MEESDEAKSLEPILHYPDVAMLNACKVLHFNIYESQVREFQKVLERHNTLCSSGTFCGKNNVPSDFPILMKRSSAFENAKRMLHDFEITILNILDKDGRVTQRSQVRDLVFIMSRAQLKVCYLIY
jgi:hypothetical protein